MADKKIDKELREIMRELDLADCKERQEINLANESDEQKAEYTKKKTTQRWREKGIPVPENIKEELFQYLISILFFQRLMYLLCGGLQILRSRMFSQMTYFL